MNEWLKIKYEEPEEDPEVRLAELEFEYCLPKWFWTHSEWTKYSYEKMRLQWLIKSRLSDG